MPSQFKRLICLGTLFAFLATFVTLPAHAQGVADLPIPGTMVSLSPAFEPVLIKGLKVDSKNPFAFDFILDTGHSNLSAQDPALKEESNKLIKYFLASMTVPEKNLWVNLSPYEKDRMIAPDLGQTEMGRDMLAQDYILKQLTASLIYPEKELGKAFWDRVYAQAQERFGKTEVPVNTFNKVWIVADKADIFERANVAYIVGAHLKVMLEEDYLAEEKSGTVTDSLNSQIVREVILPEIEKEVNQGKNFAPLRQMFYSMILASWYKMALKNALLTQVYGDQAKVKTGINVNDKSEKDQIFQRYLTAYKKGVFNYIKDDITQTDQTQQPRKYFSGGLNLFQGDAAQIIRRSQAWPINTAMTGRIINVHIKVSLTATTDRAMNAHMKFVDRYKHRKLQIQYPQLYSIAEAADNRHAYKYYEFPLYQYLESSELYLDGSPLPHTKKVVNLNQEDFSSQLPSSTDSIPIHIWKSRDSSIGIIEEVDGYFERADRNRVLKALSPVFEYAKVSFYFDNCFFEYLVAQNRINGQVIVVPARSMAKGYFGRILAKFKEYVALAQTDWEWANSPRNTRVLKNEEKQKAIAHLLGAKGLLNALPKTEAREKMMALLPVDLSDLRALSSQRYQDEYSKLLEMLSDFTSGYEAAKKVLATPINPPKDAAMGTRRNFLISAVTLTVGAGIAGAWWFNRPEWPVNVHFIFDEHGSDQSIDRVANAVKNASQKGPVILFHEDGVPMENLLSYLDKLRAI
jgi:hypothetical protein